MLSFVYLYKTIPQSIQCLDFITEQFTSQLFHFLMLSNNNNQISSIYQFRYLAVGLSLTIRKRTPPVGGKFS